MLDCDWSSDVCSSDLPVEVGQCYTVAVFGGTGVDELRLRLLDDDGGIASVADESHTRAAAQLCARKTAPFTAESEAVAGSGEVVLIVYRVDVVTAGGDAGLWLGHRAKADALRPSAKQPTSAD
jgi:hypothetical protein